ncbi:MAG TPA: hypothetical protein VLD84_01410 [Nitrososphaeraceae archaeon]|nr:hypothetical protein [Nitrososphaeraceae archaeon]
MSSTIFLSKKLSQELLSLDIDEGIVIESNKNIKCKMYINKRTSGYFVLEIENTNSTNIKEYRFYRDIRSIHRLIDRIFGKQYSITIY